MLGALTTLITLAAVAGPLAVYARHVFLEEADRVATAQALVLGSMVAEDDSRNEAQVLAHVQRDRHQDVVVTAIFLESGQKLGGPLPRGKAVEAAFHGHKAAETLESGRAVYVPARTSDGQKAVVGVVVDTTDESAAIIRVWSGIAAAVLILPAFAALLAARLGRAVTRPLDQLASAAARLERSDSQARVIPAGPSEVLRLGRAFNSLGARIDQLITAEREAVADLSHRMRTPIAVLTLQAEGLDDSTASQRLLATIRQLEAELRQVIEQARKPTVTTDGEVSVLEEVVADRIAFWGALADEQLRPYFYTYEPGARSPVWIQRNDLAAAVDALLENVFAHTPDGTPMRVRVKGRHAGGASLTVEDDGPGIPDGSVVERGRSTRGSSGLGLDIVRRLAQSSGGRLRIGRNLKDGARVTVHFGGPPVNLTDHTSFSGNLPIPKTSKYEPQSAREFRRWHM
ncbi:sensor histidine kinase [Streptomyces sp. NPDC058476]|uniref:sensor histidine kinase n=1 Tax=Streptomyces sp. NPDC058476 TaxID=3346519 RepID=UPI003648336A